MANALTAWNTQSNTQYHTPDANMTSLSVRHDRTDERGHRSSALAQRTAAARASRDQDMHSLCPCAIEASCSLWFVAKLASHCSHRTSARAHARAHVSIITTCSDAWLNAGRLHAYPNQDQRGQRERRRAQPPPLPHAGRSASKRLRIGGTRHSSAVPYFCTGSSFSTGENRSPVLNATAGCMACDAGVCHEPSRPLSSKSRKS